MLSAVENNSCLISLWSADIGRLGLVPVANFEVEGIFKGSVGATELLLEEFCAAPAEMAGVLPFDFPTQR